MKKALRYFLKIQDTTPVELQNAPDGWEDSIIKFARSDTYRGLVKSFSFPFKFVLYGATKLRSAMYQYSIKASVQLLIDRLNPNSNNYNRIFDAKIDFSKAQDEHTSFTVNAVNGDLTAKLAAYEGVKFAIPIDVPEAETLTLTPLTLKERATLTVVNRNNAQADTFPGLTVVSNEQNSVTASVQDVESRFQTDPDYGNADSWFFKATTDTPITGKIKGTIGLQYDNAEYNISIWSSKGSKFVDVFYFDARGRSGVNVFDFDVPINGNVDAGERLFLYFDSSRDGDSNQGFLISGNTATSIEINYNTTTPSSTCLCVPALYLYQQLINKVNGSEYPATSDLLTNTFGAVYITCSDAIRKVQAGQAFQAGDNLQMGSKYLVQGGAVTYAGILYAINSLFDYVQGQQGFTTNDNGYVQQVAFRPVINISFKQFYQSVKSWMGGQAGFGIEQAAVLEDLRYFYRAGLVTLDAGSIANWKLTPALELIPNSIKVGYEDQQYDVLNGTLEVNSEQRYTTPIDTLDGGQSANELDLISPIRTDCYGIEQTRIIPTDSAASRSDNDVFAVWCTRVSGDLVPLGMSGVTYSGVGADFYNWKFSPKQCLYRGGNYLASLFYGMGIYRISFAGGDKNTSMVVIDGGVRIAENEDILISSLPAPIFIPYYCNVSVGLPINALDLIQSAPYGVVSFTEHGVPMRGFIEEVSVNVGENSVQDFKLLLSPDNNLLALVR